MGLFMKKKSSALSAAWRRESLLEWQRADIVAGRHRGPEPPRAWASRLRTLIDVSRQPEEGPAWWTPTHAYFGNFETRTDAKNYCWDGMKRLSRRDHPLVIFQFTFAGFGHFELYGRAPQQLPPGTGFFAVIPSRHRYYLPPASPGWTFAWIGLYHPYLLRRIAKQVAATGPVVLAAPNSALIKRLMRLVRGAFRKDFQDRFEVEQELFAFMLAYEQLAEGVRSPESQRLLDELRARVLADPRRRLGLDTLARERGMSPTAFSHFFRAHTGMTPARFMTEARVQLAARLLETTRLSLARIASDCGFANANHFGKVFRKFRPQSAGAYRRSIG
jgi:AraC-like DNA-binding protein